MKCMRYLRQLNLRNDRRVDPLLHQTLGGEPAPVVEEGEDGGEAEGDDLYVNICVWIHIYRVSE